MIAARTGPPRFGPRSVTAAPQPASAATPPMAFRKFRRPIACISGVSIDAPGSMNGAQGDGAAAPLSADLCGLHERQDLEHLVAAHGSGLRPEERDDLPDEVLVPVLDMGARARHHGRRAEHRDAVL